MKSHNFFLAVSATASFLVQTTSAVRGERNFQRVPSYIAARSFGPDVYPQAKTLTGKTVPDLNGVWYYLDAPIETTCEIMFRKPRPWVEKLVEVDVKNPPGRGKKTFTNVWDIDKTVRLKPALRVSRPEPLEKSKAVNAVPDNVSQGISFKLKKKDAEKLKLWTENPYRLVPHEVRLRHSLPLRMDIWKLDDLDLKASEYFACPDPQDSKYYLAMAHPWHDRESLKDLRDCIKLENIFFTYEPDEPRAFQSSPLAGEQEAKSGVVNQNLSDQQLIDKYVADKEKRRCLAVKEKAKIKRAREKKRGEAGNLRPGVARNQAGGLGGNPLLRSARLPNGDDGVIEIQKYKDFDRPPAINRPRMSTDDEELYFPEPWHVETDVREPELMKRTKFDEERNTNFLANQEPRRLNWGQDQGTRWGLPTYTEEIRMRENAQPLNIDSLLRGFAPLDLSTGNHQDTSNQYHDNDVKDETTSFFVKEKEEESDALDLAKKEEFDALDLVKDEQPNALDIEAPKERSPINFKQHNNHARQPVPQQGGIMYFVTTSLMDMDLGTYTKNVADKLLILEQWLTSEREVVQENSSLGQELATALEVVSEVREQIESLRPQA